MQKTIRKRENESEEKNLTVFLYTVGVMHCVSENKMCAARRERKGREKSEKENNKTTATSTSGKN